MSKIAIGERVLRGLGACASIELARKSKNYTWLFTEKIELTQVLRDLKTHPWDPLNFIEETVWKIKYQELLRRSKWVK